MGVHLGKVERQGQHYFGAPLYRCARLLATAHGGQVVLSAAAVALVRDALPPGAGLRDLGAHRLKDLPRPERVAQLTHPELGVDFPPLRSLDARATNLPRQLTSFVGRERELAEVARRLAGAPLLTLTGPGGTGKTRLALQEAAEAFLRRVVEGQGDQPRVVSTDKRAGSPPALRRVLAGVEHRRHKGWLFRELCGECRCQGLAESLAGPCRCCHPPLSPASHPSRSTPSAWTARASALKRPVPAAARPVRGAGCSVAGCTASTSAAHATCRGGGAPRA
jgi:hypothetical protein